jgi:hypothetical protein
MPDLFSHIIRKNVMYRQIAGKDAEGSGHGVVSGTFSGIRRE